MLSAGIIFTSDVANVIKHRMSMDIFHGFVWHWFPSPLWRVVPASKCRVIKIRNLWRIIFFLVFKRFIFHRNETTLNRSCERASLSVAHACYSQLPFRAACQFFHYTILTIQLSFTTNGRKKVSLSRACHRPEE